MSPTAQRERVQTASDLLEWIRSHLDETERNQLAFELSDAARREGPTDFEPILSAWAWVLTIRMAPGYQAQIAAFRELEVSGGLFLESSLAGQDPATLAIA